MAKHTQVIRQLLPKNCLSLFDHFVGLALKGLILFDAIPNDAFCLRYCPVANCKGGSIIAGVGW